VTPEIQSESHLVKPPLHWDMQPVWDPDAEKLHGISLEKLHAQGRPPDSIPWPQADFYGGFYNGKNDHATFWTTLQRLVPQWKDNEYTDFLRGAISFQNFSAINLNSIQGRAGHFFWPRLSDGQWALSDE
jgi:hypothetical protein